MANYITKTVPQNWNRMFKIDADKVPNNGEDLFLKFTAFTPPKISLTNIAKDNLYDIQSSEDVAAYKFFQPKDNIVERINHVYAENPSKILESLSGFRDIIAKGTGFGLQLQSGGTQGSLFEEPFLYSKTDRRTFSIVLNLHAYSRIAQESGCLF